MFSGHCEQYHSCEKWVEFLAGFHSNDKTKKKKNANEFRERKEARASGCVSFFLFFLPPPLYSSVVKKRRRQPAIIWPGNSISSPSRWKVETVRKKINNGGGGGSREGETVDAGKVAKCVYARTHTIMWPKSQEAVGRQEGRPTRGTKSMFSCGDEKDGEKRFLKKEKRGTKFFFL